MTEQKNGDQSPVAAQKKTIYDILFSTTGRPVAVSGSPRDQGLEIRGRDGNYSSLKAHAATISDQLAAASSLEYETRGYHVDYVLRDNLSSGKNLRAQVNHGAKRATIVVDDMRQVSELRDAIREHPADWRSLKTEGKRAVERDERFEAIAERVSRHTMPAPR